MTPLRIVLGLNGLALLAGYATAYTFNYGGEALLAAIVAPFVISGINLCLGFATLILMGILKTARRDTATTADKYMQAFMISFGVVFAFAVPACFITFSHR